MLDMKSCSDEELIQLYRDGEQACEGYLFEKYKPLVLSKAKSMYILGAEPEDLIQEGMIGLFRAIKDYDAGRDASFFTFAQLCINRSIYNAVTAAKRVKHIPLNSYISLSTSDENKDDERELIDTYIPTEDNSPEAVLIDRENTEDLEKKIDEELSNFEKQVLELHLTGMGYKEIAAILGKEEKSTDNALQRIKSKVKKLLKN